MKRTTAVFAALVVSVCALQGYSASAAESESTHKPGHAYVLEGNASMDVDADAGNKDVLVEWDQWRNKIVHAMWTKWGAALDGGMVNFGGLKLDIVGHKKPYDFHDGEQATFACTITKDRQIENAHITRSSGDPVFDQLVLKSVKAVSGKSVLAFPKDSKRDSVIQASTFRIGGNGFHDHEFGDVERNGEQ